MERYDYTFVHCLFEQSHTFANAVNRYGCCSALDYDIADGADIKVDIFLHIDKYFQGLPSLFDNIKETDLVLAFFPCTYFSGFNKPMVSMTADISQYRTRTPNQRARIIADRVSNFAVYYGYICKLVAICQNIGCHLIIENPEHCSFLLDFTPVDNFFIDYDRSLHGDFYKKPTFYFFVNRPVPLGFDNGNAYRKERKQITHQNGMLNRSLISAVYADWFVKNVIFAPYEYENTFFKED